MSSTFSFGPLLIGVLLNTTLYGVLLIQAAVGLSQSILQRVLPLKIPIEIHDILWCFRDPKWFRYLILFLFVAETANVVFDIMLIYEPLISGWGNPKALEISPLFLRPDAAVIVAISTPVQLFVAWRIKILRNSYVLPTLITLLALISLGGGLSVTVNVSLRPDYADFGHFRPFVATWLAASAVCDVVLTAALMYSLHKRKGAAQSTDRYIDRLIRCEIRSDAHNASLTWIQIVIVHTGAITAVTALLDLRKNWMNHAPRLNARVWRDPDPEVNRQYPTNVLFKQPSSEGRLEIRNTVIHIAPENSSQPLELHPRARHRALSNVAAHPMPDINAHLESESETKASPS
ncbi:hypothetical protein GGX14DRAFT_643346 [Mycena pura]|uniref:Uncharacterized protein n=1 Tax=Mycena pura TaxID=153505 RepID=A0AAD6VD00_9AGAR|nr:hypothetical protein GGX14DRAFT_643346 [Mycena pura]